MHKENTILRRNLTLSMVPVDDGILASVNGELKKLECDHKVLTEVLKKADKPAKYTDITEELVGKYEREEVEAFLDVLVDEGLFKAWDEGSPVGVKLRIVGEGRLTSFIKYELPADISVIETVSADEYLESDHKADGTVTLIVSEDNDIGTVVRLNEKLVKEENPFTMITVLYDKVLLGPSVVPWKSACIGCYYTHQLEQLNSVSESDLCFRDIEKLSHSVMPEKLPVDIGTYIKKALDEVRIISSKSALPSYVNKICEYDLRNCSRLKDISFPPTTACPCCNGMNKHVISYKEYRESTDDSLRFLSEEKILYKTGGFRSADADETEKLLDDVVERTGIEVTVEEAEDNPLAEVMPSFGASIKTNCNNKTPFIFQAINSQGKGLNPRQAYFSACFELFERLSARYYGDKRIIRATPGEVGCGGYSFDIVRAQRKRLDSEWDIDPEQEIDWVEARSVVSGKSKLVPASMVYLSNASFRSYENEISSTGLAAGATLEDAVLQGLFEVIEHDAWIMGQANRVVLPRIDIYSSKNEDLKALMREIEKLGFEIITRDYSNDLGFPVFRTWIVNRDDLEHYAVNGFGASLSAEITLERSVTEAVQSLIPEKDIDICDYGTVSEFESMYSYDSFYSLSYFVQKDINSDGPVKNMDEFGEVSFVSVHDMIDTVSQRIREVLGENSDILYADLTKDAIGVPVVRVIVEGDIQRTGDPIRALSRRTLEYPVVMGYSEKQAEIQELYLGPYPH